MLVFKERGQPEYPEKNLSEQRREPTTNLRRSRDLNPGHIGGGKEKKERHGVGVNLTVCFGVLDRARAC